MKLETPMELTRESSALVVVDMQIEGCERHGPGMGPVIRNIQGLLSQFREANGKVIHVHA